MPVLEDMPIDEDELLPPDKPPVMLEELICQEPGCNRELHYGGRGRKPRFCDEHKSRAGKPRTQTTTATGKRAVASTEKLAVELSNKIMSGAVLVMPFKPATGLTLAAWSDTLANDLAESASKHPKLKKLLNTNLRTGADAKLVTDVGLLALAIGMQNGLALPPIMQPFLTLMLSQKMASMLPEIQRRCEEAGIDITEIAARAAASTNDG